MTDAHVSAAHDDANAAKICRVSTFGDVEKKKLVCISTLAQLALSNKDAKRASCSLEID